LQKLLKSRENLKQYLVTGKINPEEITNLGLTSHKIVDTHQDSTAGATNNQIDFSQDWEKISVNSHNSNLIVFNSKKNLPTLISNASKPNLTVPTQNLSINNKLKLQETKTKIDKYFNAKSNKAPDNFTKRNNNLNNIEKNSDINPISVGSHLKLNHFETGTSHDLKSEHNVSMKNISGLKNNTPKIITHNTDTKHLALAANRPPSQSKIHLKKNAVNDKK
jgi:hypothetical protein